MGQEKLGILAESVDLPASELAAFESLEADQIEHLVQALQAAQRRQSTALEEAIQRALGHVPKLLHRPILKILGR